MEKGKLLRYTEEVSENARERKDFEFLEQYNDYAVGQLTLWFLRKLSFAAANGKKRTSIKIEGNGLEPRELINAKLIMSAVNQTIQEDFQTVIEYEQEDLKFKLKLIAFWSDGLDEYYKEVESLDEADRPQLVVLESPEIHSVQEPFRPRLVGSES